MKVKKTSIALSSRSLLLIRIEVIGSAEEIIEGYVEIIGEFYKGFIICFSFAILIAADAVLVHVEVEREL